MCVRIAAYVGGDEPEIVQEVFMGGRNRVAACIGGLWQPTEGIRTCSHSLLIRRSEVVASGEHVSPSPAPPILRVSTTKPL